MNFTCLVVIVQVTVPETAVAQELGRKLVRKVKELQEQGKDGLEFFSW